jgi:adenylate cyclase
MDTKASAPLPKLAVRSFDGPLGRNIIKTHIWAVREGLRGASAYDLFDGYCQRLVIHGVPLWRAGAAMETLHPWSGYGYTWLSSPMDDLIRRAHDGEDDPWMRRRVELGPEQRDFAVLDEFFSQGATDYFSSSSSIASSRCRRPRCARAVAKY